jgi:DNA-binding response OmpR family regulator
MSALPALEMRMASHGQRPGSAARALMVMAEPVLAEAVELALDHGQYSTRMARTVEEATAALAGWRPHLAILDMEIAGGGILEELRSTQEGRRLPVIAVTRRGDLSAKLTAFARGVDDVLTVPFFPEELSARTLAVMRRSYSEGAEFTPPLRLGDLEIDIQNRRVRSAGTNLHLTRLERSLLYLLATNAGRVLTRDEILDSLWGADYMAESNVVDRHIRSLRTKLQDHSRRPRYIATVPGRGYRFMPTPAAGAGLSSH